MIQYGEIRHFNRGENVIRAIPKFNTPIDPDLTPDALIDSVVITHMNGDSKNELESLKNEIQQKYTGAKYSVWMQGVIR